MLQFASPPKVPSSSPGPVQKALSKHVQWVVIPEEGDLRNANGRLENTEITDLRKPGAGGAPPYGCNLGLAPKTLRTDKGTFTTFLIKRTRTQDVESQ